MFLELKEEELLTVLQRDSAFDNGVWSLANGQRITVKRAGRVGDAIPEGSPR